MTDKKWKQIKKVMMRDFEVVDQNLEEEDGGTLHKEILVVQGKKGLTKFTRHTRQSINEDPMDLSTDPDWSLNGYAIASFLEVHRQNPTSQDWEQLDVNKVVK